MSIKNKRISMLAALYKSLGDIEVDAKNQNPERLAENMKVLQSHVKEILSLDGVGMLSDD
jgi:hypothetical protein|tara:strand:+ start:68 stop:247 length:180 start_codon:yes stop_codon:yes gene_type:complete